MSVVLTISNLIMIINNKISLIRVQIHLPNNVFAQIHFNLSSANKIIKPIWRERCL